MATYAGGRNLSYSGAGVFTVSYDLTAAADTTAGGVVAIANPVGADVVITNAFINITTAATTSSNTMDVGVAANATTSSDTLFDEQRAAIGVKSPGGTNGAVPRLWASGQYVTATAGATLAGMVATITLICVRA